MRTEGASAAAVAAAAGANVRESHRCGRYKCSLIMALICFCRAPPTHTGYYYNGAELGSAAVRSVTVMQAEGPGETLPLLPTEASLRLCENSLGFRPARRH